MSENNLVARPCTSWPLQAAAFHDECANAGLETTSLAGREEKPSAFQETFRKQLELRLTWSFSPSF